MNLPNRSAVFHQIGRFVTIWIEDFRHNKCRVEAAALTFFTLLALVPLLILLAKLVSIIPSAAQQIAETRQLIYHLLVPESAVVVEQYLNNFAQRANSITLAGIPLLILSVLVVMMQLEHTLSQIFGMPSRSLFKKIVYGTLAVLFGPFVFSLVFSASSWITHMPIFSSWGAGTQIISFATQGIIASAFFVCIPSRRLPLSLILLGGILLAIGQTVLQTGFTEILGRISNYQMIYGVFAAIPLLLLWIYCCWLMLLGISVFINTIRRFSQSGHQKAR